MPHHRVDGYGEAALRVRGLLRSLAPTRERGRLILRAAQPVLLQVEHIDAVDPVMLGRPALHLPPETRRFPGVAPPFEQVGHDAAVAAAVAALAGSLVAIRGERGVRALALVRAALPRHPRLLRHAHRVLLVIDRAASLRASMMRSKSR
jgi:hypothetical protein